MSKEMRHDLIKILISLSLFLLLFLLRDQLPQPVLVGGYLAVYLLSGYEVVKRAVVNIFHGQVFDENFLMSLATIGAFALQQYSEAVAVMVFYQIGEWFQSLAVNKSRRSIEEMMAIQPKIVHLKTAEGEKEVDPAEVEVGESFIVYPGERIPLDGVVTAGSSYLDTSALTGESVPRKVSLHEDVLSGCINTSGALTVRAAKEYSDSAISKILELVEDATEQKAPTENFITKFARYYTPFVVFAALLVAIVPPLFFHGEFSDWLLRALTFLVISCPCALVISVPLSFFGGIGGASKEGILVKGSNYLEALDKMKTMVFDKTGTLTQGKFEVQTIQATDLSKAELLNLAASLEASSTHPIAQSIVRANGEETLQKVAAIQEISGKGITGKINGKVFAIGNQKLMNTMKVTLPAEGTLPGTVVYLAEGRRFLGSIAIQDALKAETRFALNELKNEGVGRMILLSGDNRTSVEQTVGRLPLDEVYTDLLPQDKVAHFQKIIEAQKDGTVAYVGDGLNDAPVLARADVGIAMGGLGSDAAIEAADVVIMTDDLEKIPLAKRIARKTLRIVHENIIFSLGVKAVVLVLGVLGLATMTAAVFADVGVTVLAVFNAMRCLNTAPLLSKKDQTKAQKTTIAEDTFG